MLYKNVFNLTGTDEQQGIVKDALDAIKFPFERLHVKNGTATIGWANLNGQALKTGLPNNMEVQLDEAKAIVSGAVPLTKDDITAYPEDVAKIDYKAIEEVRHHEGTEPNSHDHSDEDPDYHEPLMGRLEGREYVLGVFYPFSGDIYVDNLLVKYPHYAQTTVSAEIAHSVDEFLPLNDVQRDEIMKLVNGGDSTGLTWWEKVDYSAEYYNLIGETFMILFTYAYSDLGFEGAEDFTWHGDPSMGDEVRAIVGIERTDAVEPVPTPVPEPTPAPAPEPVPEPAPEPTPEPEPAPPSEPTPVEPTPEPVPDTEGGSQTGETGDSGNSGDTGDSGGNTVPSSTFVKYGKSKVYHLPTHYKNKKNAVEVTDVSQLRLCKICAKHLA
jgi:hypothetical protein